MPTFAGMKTLLKLGTGLGVAAGAYALLLRRRMLRWGATDAELEERTPGSQIIPDASPFSTMAVTIAAPPSAVWPWLAQMGSDRGGWYSWDRLDHGGIPSARTLLPEWQPLSIGQRLKSTPDGKHWFEVAGLEPQRFLALRVFTADGRQVDPVSPRPAKFSDSLWEFQLKELTGGRTRLVVRVSTISRPKLVSTLMSYLFLEPAHFIMQTRQFTNLKRRAEAMAREAPLEHPVRPRAQPPRAQA